MRKTLSRVINVLVTATLLLALVPAAAAEPIPPRPDLLTQLRQRDPEAPGFRIPAGASEADAVAEFENYLRRGYYGPAPVPSAPKLPPASAQATVQERAIVLLVEFPDLAHDHIPAPPPGNNSRFWTMPFSGDHYRDLFFRTSTSLRAYFLEQSYSQFELMNVPWNTGGSIVVDWGNITVTQNAALYGDDAPGALDMQAPYTIDDFAREVISRATTLLNGWGLPWANFDRDGDGYIDHLFIVHAGQGQEAGGGALGDSALWSQMRTLSPAQGMGGGKSAGQYIVVPEDVTVGTLAWFLAKQLGAPETRNTNARYPTDAAGNNESSAAFWDLMADGYLLGNKVGTSPAHMNAWQRQRLGWLTPVTYDIMSQPQNVTLGRLEGNTLYPKALRINLPDYSPNKPHGGSYYWWSGMEPSQTDTLEQVLSVGPSTTAYFRFYTWYDTEASYDLGLLQMSINGSTWITVDSVSGRSVDVPGNVNGWLHKSVDLKARFPGWPGGSLWVRYTITTDSDKTGVGWFLDDLSLVLDGVTTWGHNAEEGTGGWSVTSGNWSRTTPPTFQHYYLAEWRARYGFDVAYNQGCYYLTDPAAGTAAWFSYNPGLLVWYVNQRWAPGENYAGFRPGEGFLLPVDAHPTPIVYGSTPFRPRVQMNDATFNTDATVAQTLLGVPLGSQPAVRTFYDANSYWSSADPDNSVRHPTYGVKLYVEEHAADMSWGKIGFSIDAGNLSTSTKSVDKATVIPGQTLTYTIVIRNTGIADAYTANLTDTLPLQVTYAGYAWASSGTVTYNAAARAIRWTGTATLSTPVTVTFRVTVNTPLLNGSYIINTANIYEGATLEASPSASTRVTSWPVLTTSSKAVSSPTVRAGDPVTWTVILRNTGTDNGNVDVTDPIPTNTAYVAGTATATLGTITYNSGLNRIEWNGPATVGTPVTLTFRTTVNAGTAAGTVIMNTATINDHVNAPFTVQAFTTVIAAPNFVGSTKDVDKTVAHPAEELLYTITIRNTGNTSGMVYLTDTIPLDTAYVAGSVSNAVYYPGTDDVRWSGAIAPLATRVVTFRVRIDIPLTNGTLITNTALIGDPTWGVHVRQTVTSIISEPDLTTSVKRVQATSAASGGVLTYTITLTNTGTSNTTVCVTDTIPPDTSYVSGSLTYSSGSGSYDAGLNRITWCGPVPVGTSAWIRFAVQITLGPTATGIITNTATINDHVHPPFNRSVTTWVAMLWLDCPTTSPYSGDYVDVPLKVSNVYDLQGVEVHLQFVTTTLEVVDVIQGSWFSPSLWPVKTWDNTAGTIDIATVLNAQPVGKSGSGTLCTLRFRGKAGGTVPITIAHSVLSTAPLPLIIAIPHNTKSCSGSISGTVRLYARTNHSGASILVNGVPTTVTDAGGNYTFFTPGSSFTVRVTMPGYLWAQRPVSAGPTTLITLPNVVLLGGDAVGGNQTVYRPVTCTVTGPVVIPGPQDGIVNIQDLTFVGGKFGMMSADPWWGPDPCYPVYGDYDVRNYHLAYKADINGDGFINIFDLVAVGTNFNKVAPSPWP